MTQFTLQMNRCKQQLRESIEQGAAQGRLLKFAKHSHVYTCGDQDDTVYLIESGQVKLLMLAPDGRECLLNVLTAGDIFGELCLAGVEERRESAMAMSQAVLRAIPRAQFLACLYQSALFESFVHHLSLRIAEQQSIIADLVTIDSEQRLGKTLLNLAYKLSKHVPQYLQIESRITHEELAAMVGTTRPRVSEFMQRFRALGLIEINAEQGLIIQVQKLDAYLTRLN